jgi:hypothetical protein
MSAMPIPQPPILQFINNSTGTIRVGDTPVDLHWDLRDRVAWLCKGTGGEKSFATDGEFGEIQHLWTVAKNLTGAIVDQKPYLESDLELLNSWARKPNLILELGTLGLVHSCASLSAAQAWVAVQVVYLLGTAKPRQIRKCQGCWMFFYDPSPSGRQKWCSMARCGNLAKVRAFNARKRTPSASG